MNSIAVSAKNQSAVNALLKSGYGFDKVSANRLVSNLENRLDEMFERFFAKEDSDDTVRILSEAFPDLVIETDTVACDCESDYRCPHGEVTYVRFGGHEFGHTNYDNEDDDFLPSIEDEPGFWEYGE